MASNTTPFVAPDTSNLSKAAFLVGNPIAHSGSPALHRNIYDSVNQPRWAQLLSETSDLAAFISFLRSEPKAMGSGVTMPFKVAVIPYLDQLTPEAQAIGAVNTIFFKPGPDGQRLFYGTNTDCLGIRDAFLTNVSPSAVTSYRGRPGLVIGGGGTCRAAVYALQKFIGCSEIYIINRDKGEVDAVIGECRARGNKSEIIHVESVTQARSLTPPAAIVSAVPDFTPQTTSEKIVRSILKHFLTAVPTKGALLEMCYHPSPNTQITQLSIEAGWQVIGGVEAMIGQGLAQASLWTGIEITEAMRAAARKEVLARNATKQVRATTSAVQASELSKLVPVTTVSHRATATVA
ncbi:hypothetical protein R6Q59_010052 [Mikania micrantha]